MPESLKPSINSWLEDELYHQYLHDRLTVDPDWKEVFESNGHAAPANGTVAVAPAPKAVAAPVAPGDQLVPLRGPALRIAENMTEGLAIKDFATYLRYVGEFQALKRVVETYCDEVNTRMNER